MWKFFKGNIVKSFAYELTLKYFNDVTDRRGVLRVEQ
jgi:hypothetical protein